MGVFLLGTLTARAQQLRVAYFGETLTHYGAKVGYEMPLLTQPDHTVRHELFASLNLTVYRHPKNHIGLIVSPELTYRRTGRRGGFYELALSPAYFRYFLEGTTYRVAAGDRFEKVSMAGGNAFLPTVSLGFGKNLAIRRDIPLSWYARLNLMQQRPYNTSRLTRFGIEVGILKSLKKS